MKRRSFIKSAIGTTVTLPFMLNGMRVSALARGTVFDALLGSVTNDHILVLVQLVGGNDGLNTVIPLDIYGTYKTARPNIAIPETSALKLNAATGLHPAMTGMKNVYNAGKVRLVQGVGYPNFNDSHFRSTDIWLTGSESYEVLTTGWAGRFLETEYPDFPNGYPNATMPDPLAIQIGTAASTALEGPRLNMGMVFSDTRAIYNLSGGLGSTPPNTRAGKELQYIRDVDKQVAQMGQRILDVANANNTVKSALWAPIPATDELAAQLKVVAQLIRGGLKSRMYFVTLTGFDTHTSQGAATGMHATLLGKLSQSVAAFQDELYLGGVEDRVVGMTFSEFGRRVKDNGSGTDHGAAAPLFVFGSNVIPGVLGNSPTLPANPTAADQVPMQYDFRSIYASLLKDWFKISNSALLSVMYKDYPILPIIKGGSSAVYDKAGGTGLVAVMGNYPNPAAISTLIRFRTPAGRVNMTVFDNGGQVAGQLIDRTLTEGEHQVTFNTAGLASGTYYCRLQCGAAQTIHPILVSH